MLNLTVALADGSLALGAAGSADTPIPVELHGRDAGPSIRAELEAPLLSVARIGAWMPLWLRLTNDAPSFEGTVELSIGGVTWRRNLSLPSGSQRRLTFFVIPYATDLSIRIALSTEEYHHLFAGSAGLSLPQQTPSKPAALLLVATAQDAEPLRDLLPDDSVAAPVDASSVILSDARAYDPANVVMLSSAALSTLRLPARQALLQYLNGGGSVLFVLPHGAPEPEAALQPWYEHEIDGAGQEVPIHRSEPFPQLGWLNIGAGRLVYLAATPGELFDRDAWRQELARALLLDGAATARHAMLQPVQEDRPEILGRVSWTWHRRSRWLITIGACVLAMTGFLLPVLKRRSTWVFYLGAAAASLSFAAVFYAVALPGSSAILQTAGIVRLRSGSPLVLIERWAELRANGDTTAELSAAFDANVKPVFASWPQLAQSASIALELPDRLAWRMKMVKDERRWFRLLDQDRLARPLMARIEAAEASAGGERRVALSVNGALPVDLDRTVLLWNGQATAVGRLSRGQPARLVLPEPRQTLSGAVSRASDAAGAIDPFFVRLMRHWERQPHEEKPYLLGWSSSIGRGPFEGRFGDLVQRPVLYVIELAEAPQLPVGQ